MKSKKTVSVIALTLVFALSAVACSGQTINSVDALKAYLDKQPANSPDKPIQVTVTANDMMIKNIAAVIRSAGKYVSLTLSGSALKTIPEDAFVDREAEKGCETLVSVTIPNSVTTIGESAFWHCTSLARVTIPNSVTSIGRWAFSSTKLTSVTIPNSVTSIGDLAFISCTSLTTINVDSGNTAYSSLDGVLYNKDKSTLIQYPAGKANSTFSIPDSVTSIGEWAFSRCASLASVTIGNSVTAIGIGAFDQCSSLASVTIPNGVTSIVARVFSRCTSLASVTIPDSVTSIGGEAFAGCTSLASVRFEGKVTLNSSAFGSSMFEGLGGEYIGDLRAKYLASNGGPGTYTRSAGGKVWRKQ